MLRLKEERRLERLKRLKKLAEREEERQHKRALNANWIPEMSTSRLSPIQETPMLVKNNFAPILDRKNMTVPIRKEDAIDLSVTLPPPIIEPIPQKITIEPLKEEDDDAKEDIFQVLDRQRKEQKWRKFKTKLHLTNWVEDLILDRFSDYDQQLKLEKEE